MERPGLMVGGGGTLLVLAATALTINWAQLGHVPVGIAAGFAVAGAVAIGYGWFQSRPMIDGEIHWWQSLPPPCPIGVVLVADLINKGLATGLRNWQVTAIVNGTAYPLEVQSAQLESVFHPLSGREVVFEVDAGLAERTRKSAIEATPVAGYVWAVTHELSREELAASDTRIFLQCQDTSGRSWDIHPVDGAGSRREAPRFSTVIADS